MAKTYEALATAWLSTEERHDVAKYVAQALEAEYERGRDERDAEMRRFSSEIADALGTMNFQSCPLAHVFRAAGHDIPRKAEQEQAFVLHWFLTLIWDHGAEWRAKVAQKLEELRSTIEGKAKSNPT